MDDATYQVELRNPGKGREDYWGPLQQLFSSKQEAVDYAVEDCPDGWAWRVVRVVRPEVVAEGRKAIAA